MNAKRLFVTGFAALMLSASASAATITSLLYTPSIPAGTLTPVDLSGITAPSNAGFAGTGYSVSFSGVAAGQGVVQGHLGGAHAVPVAGSGPDYLTGGIGSALTTDITQAGNYFSTGLGSITITFVEPQNSVALLWGSVDFSNSLTFNDVANTVVTGTQIQGLTLGFTSNGAQGPGGSAWVLIKTDTPFTTLTATSSVVSFEFAALTASEGDFTTSQTPEPSTLLLSIAGVGLLVARRFTSKR